MAFATLLPAMSVGSDKSVHPFFKRPAQTERPRANASTSTAGSTKYDDGDDAEYQDEKTEVKPKKANSKRKPKKSEQEAGTKKTQKTLGEIVNSKANGPSSTVVDITGEPDVNENRKKRRRTNEHESVDVGVEEHTPPKVNGDVQDHVSEGRASPRVLVPASSPLPKPSLSAKDHSETEETLALKTPPKKQLRLNAKGKFSSPPLKKTQGDEALPGPPKRRGRPRKSKLASPEKHLLVKVKYGQPELGDRIERILSGTEIVQARTRPKKSTPRKPKPTKPAHPFFSRDAAKKQQAPPKQESPRKTSAVTPGKLRMQSMADRAQEPKDTSQAIGSALLRDRLMIRHPGAKEAPFPPRELAHVRGFDAEKAVSPTDDDFLEEYFGRRKRKQARLPVPKEDSILTRFASKLDAPKERRLRADGFHDPSTDLHLPERLLISGCDIAERVSRELFVSLVSADQDEISVSPPKYIHPSPQRLYDRVPTIMTAFDDTKGESSSWTQKYAPIATSDVLQPENEMAVLKDWLKSLAVQSVEGVVAAPLKTAQSRAAEKPKKTRKRKNKADEMDDFLVDSDEEVTEMSELVDVSEHGGSPSASRKVQRSVVQVAHDGTKLSNAVLLRGPSGCGKTATAYAVAKEMGFKVFEISSSERRSGKDVIDKVGDMTENHLVKHHGTDEAGEMSSTEEPGQMDEAFQRDLESGRQGKMSAFFKPKANPKPKQTEPKKVVKEKKLKAVQEAIKKQPKDQQQSLILLEEVDVLFKDDKEFWTTVLKLITTSKRPFIMTCNDEDLVPLQAMSLHAILRFAPPPLDLATDYMLLVAAAEGHLLRRESVAFLYQQHRLDLRATISELDCWCQMGVGDPRGGLSWIYQRYPPGSDLDAHGRKLRVVSDGTYKKGMATTSTSQDTEEALVWAWNELGVDPATALNIQNMPPALNTDSSADMQQRRRALQQISKFADCLSVADACSANALPEAAPLDPTQPEIPEKARGHYIEGMALMQTDELVDYTDMGRHLFAAIALTASRTYCCSELQSQQILDNAWKHRSESRIDEALGRHAFACFDAIAVPKELSATGPGLVQSVFDGPLETITLDLAPYVRCIVHSDQAREEMRARLNLLTSDGRKAKRARTTRAARSALEGGQRATTRREKWLPNELNAEAVLATGGKAWPQFSNALDVASTDGGSSVRDGTGDTAPASSAEDEIQYE